MDCISLGIIWSQYMNTMHIMVPKLDMRKTLSAAGVAWKCVLHMNNVSNKIPLY